MDIFWVFAGFGAVAFLALAGVALVILAARRTRFPRP
jgi:hypothetical protein